MEERESSQHYIIRDTLWSPSAEGAVAVEPFSADARPSHAGVALADLATELQKIIILLPWETRSGRLLILVGWCPRILGLNFCHRVVSHSSQLS